MRLVLAISFLLLVSPLTGEAQQVGGRAHALVTRSQTKEAEFRLAELGFWTGPIDGVLDASSRSALIAFQKWEGRSITGRLTLADLEAMLASDGPKAREPGYEHVEVDIERQILMLVNETGSVRILPVSTGSGKTFLSDGEPSIAYTPRGRFVVYDKGLGWEDGKLGSIYYANYISGGVAIHGYETVPTEPASHGCIRIPMFAAQGVSRFLKLGTIVLVYDKVTFVSAKSWVENPQLKEAALRINAAPDYVKQVEETRPRALVNKKTRMRSIRA